MTKKEKLRRTNKKKVYEEKKMVMQKQQQELEKEKKKIMELEREKAKEMRNKWSSMKMKPQMNVEERNDAYVVTSHIPGLNKNEINLNFEPKTRTLTIEGVRIPSENEEKPMKQQN